MSAHARLKDARIAAGFASASEAARALAVANSTYTQHENGKRAMRVTTFDAYMTFFAQQPGAR